MAPEDGRGRVRWQFKEFPDPAWSGWLLLALVCAATPASYLAGLRADGLAPDEWPTRLRLVDVRLDGRVSIRARVHDGGDAA
jgi:hypothetical protein